MLQECNKCFNTANLGVEISSVTVKKMYRNLHAFITLEAMTK